MCVWRGREREVQWERKGDSRTTKRSDILTHLDAAGKSRKPQRHIAWGQERTAVASIKNSCHYWHKCPPTLWPVSNPYKSRTCYSKFNHISIANVWRLEFYTIKYYKKGAKNRRELYLRCSHCKIFINDCKIQFFYLKLKKKVFLESAFRTIWSNCFVP